jgi:hypothetical protein
MAIRASYTIYVAYTDGFTTTTEFFDALTGVYLYTEWWDYDGDCGRY